MIADKLVIGLGIALAVSVLANITAGKLYLDKRDELATSEERANANMETARACSRGVDKLVTAANDRARDAEQRRKNAETAALLAQGRANELLTKQPAVPGDDCKSAKIQGEDWLAQRRARKAAP